MCPSLYQTNYETHNQTHYTCSPKFVQEELCVFGIKTYLTERSDSRFEFHHYYKETYLLGEFDSDLSKLHCVAKFSMANLFMYPVLHLIP